MKINGGSIMRVQSTKFVGVIIDSKLNWAEHTSMVKNEVSKGYGVICKARNLLKKETLIIA